MNKNKPTVISLGGSIVVPSGGIAVDFIAAFRDLVLERIKAGQRFVLVVGGGATAREYIRAAEKIDETVSAEDKDWLGIHGTRINAQLLRTVFRAVAHPRVNDNPHRYEEFLACAEPVIIASGWRPGFSTDFDAVVLGKNLGADTVVNLSNIDHVYDRDPRRHSDARPLERLNWSDYGKLIGGKWTPGMHAPFDPVASRFARENAMKVVILSGENLSNLRAYLGGEEWQGTLIAD